MLTEALIRRALDGTFTKLTWTEHGPRVSIKVVERGFVPDYTKPPVPPRVIAEPGVGKGRYTRGLRKVWTAEQDAMLIELRRAGVSLNACTGILQRGIKAVRHRAHLLMSQEAV